MINVMGGGYSPSQKTYAMGRDGVLVGLCVNLGVIRALSSRRAKPVEPRGQLGFNKAYYSSHWKMVFNLNSG